MIGAHVSKMKDLELKPIASVAVLLAAVLAVGCTSTGTTGDSSPARNSRSGGWENFRAEAVPQPEPSVVA